MDEGILGTESTSGFRLGSRPLDTPWAPLDLGPPALAVKWRPCHRSNLSRYGTRVTANTRRLLFVGRIKLVAVPAGFRLKAYP